MLKGKDLGQAIERAIELKGVSKADIARHFGVKAPSVQGWIATGRIGKERLFDLFDYFNDVVTYEHWGIKHGRELVRHRRNKPRSDHPSQSLPVSQYYIRFQRLDVEATAGHGGEPVDYPEVLEEVDVLESWARQSLGATDPAHIKIITCKGDSMTPTIQPGDIVFVDTALPRFSSDGVYVLIWQGRLLIKRLRALMDGRLAIQSDNAVGYETEYVSAAQVDQMALCGRVLGWWTLRRF